MKDDEIENVFVRAWNNFNVPIKSCVAYCMNHKYYLTEKQLKRKGCLNRNCSRLFKLDKHPYWIEKEKKKKLRKKAKEKFKYGNSRFN